MAWGDDELGDRALRALIALGVPRADRAATLAELHRRAAVRWNLTLVSCLKELPDRSSLDLVLQRLGLRADGVARYAVNLRYEGRLPYRPSFLVSPGSLS